MTIATQTVTWIKCQEGKIWCPFETVNLSNVTAHGVYIIGYDSGQSSVYTIYVGQGDIAARLQAHRTNPDILKYRNQGTLRATWASVSAANRDGVERYVADKLKPSEGSQHPNVRPIPVNLPAGWY